MSRSLRGTTASATSLSTSVNTPPRPTATTGPKTGSRFSPQEFPVPVQHLLNEHTFESLAGAPAISRTPRLPRRGRRRDRSCTRPPSVLWWIVEPTAFIATGRRCGPPLQRLGLARGQDAGGHRDTVCGQQLLRRHSSSAGSPAASAFSTIAVATARACSCTLSRGIAAPFIALAAACTDPWAQLYRW